MARISPMGALFLGILAIGSLLVVADGKLLDADYPTSCPKKDPMEYVVQLPHESDCTKYYKCQRGKKILQSCPVADKETGERLFFNPETHTCDWESNVDCEQPEPTLVGLRKILPVPTECPKNDTNGPVVHLAHEYDCTKFYKCQFGKKILQDCPCDEDGTRLYFNKFEQVCDFSFNVDCESSPSWATPCPAKEDKLKLKLSALKKILPVPTECPKRDSNEFTVHLAHEYDCTKFYKCQYGKRRLQDCPCDEDGTRLYFNKFKQVCDFSFNVDCESSPSWATPCPAKEDKLKLKLSAFKKILPVPTKCPKKDSKEFTVHLAHESDCTKFYKCQYGKRRLQDCPCDEDRTRLYFNRVEQVCDFSFNVDCESDPRLATPCPGDDRTDRPPVTEVIPPHTKPTTPHTPPPKPVPGGGEGPSLGCRTTCPNNDPPNRITPLPHNDCRKWCRCQNNQVTVHLCPNDFHFSPTLEYCTTPETAGCRSVDEPLMNILGYNDRFMW